MKEAIAKEATHVIKDWLALGLAGLGITLPVHEFIGGTLLAMAAASIMARHRKDPRRVWLTVGTGAFFGLVVAMFWPSGGLHVLGFVLPVQSGMLIAGFGSKWGVNIIGKFFDRAEFRTDEMSDSLFDRLSGKKDKDEE